MHPVHPARTLPPANAVADKVMVSTAFVMLVTSPPKPLSVGITAAPVAIMIGREISMSALREWAAASSEAAHSAVKVNTFGKWKTACQVRLLALQRPPAVKGRLRPCCRRRTPPAPLSCPQMAAMTALLFLRNMPAPVAELLFLSKEEHQVSVCWVSFGFLWVSTLLSAYSFSVYFKNAWEHFFIPPPPKKKD